MLEKAVGFPMALARGQSTTTAIGLTRYVEIGMELLWLITAALIPLIFVPTDYFLSEAVNAYVEVPKTVALRSLAGLMTILWVVEWLVKGGLHRDYSIERYSSRIVRWIAEQPSRWVVIAAILYIVVAISTTFLSTSFHRSAWGEVSGQFGYSAYTTASYFLLFIIMATHLKTYQQLWNLLIVLVASSTAIAFFGIMQHYGFDPWDLGEGGRIRVSATMANPVFTGAFLVSSTLLVFGLGLAILNSWVTSHKRLLFWGLLWIPLVAMQMLAVYWTGSRGSWLLGVPFGFIAFMHLPVLSEFISSWKDYRRLPLDLVILVSTLIVLDVLLLVGQLEFLDQVNRLDLSHTGAARIVGAWLGLLVMVSIVVLLMPARFSAGMISFAKTTTFMAAGLLVLLLVVALTPGPEGNPGMDLKGLSGLPNTQILLVVVGLVAALGFAGMFFLTRIGPMLQAMSKATLVVGAGLLILLFVFQLNPASIAPPPGTEDPSAVEAPAEEQPTDIAPVETGRGLSFRTDIWSASLRLTVNRPWFDYEPLSLSFFRPLIGYGPEMFKYTFPLESPLGGLLSHAHNFFLHHWVEQGILGLFTSVGLVMSFFLVGVAQLWRNWSRYSEFHRWILVALLATMLGRVTEMMVGVARESDLVPFWIILGMMVILPSVLIPTPQTAGASVPENQPANSGRRQGRGRNLRRRDRQTRRNATAGPKWGPLQFIGATLAVLLIGAVGWLTWDRSLEYASAARSAASARDHFVVGASASPPQFSEIQRSHGLMSDAVSSAPDVPNYHNNLAGIFEAYRSFGVNRSAPEQPLQGCAVFFSLREESEVQGRPAEVPPFARCAEEAYLSNFKGFQENITSPQAKLTLANSTMTLALMGYEGKAVEAIGYFEELTDMLPSAFNLYDALGSSYLRLGLIQQGIDSLEQSLLLFGNDPGADDALRARLISGYNTRTAGFLNTGDSESALGSAARTLELTGGSREASVPLFFQGVVYRQLERTEDAIRSFEDSLLLVDSGQTAADALQNLIQLYTSLGETDLAQENQNRLDQLLEQ